MNLQQEIIQLIENNNVEEAFYKIQQYQDEYGKDEFFYLAFSDILLFQGMFDQVILLITEAGNDGYENELFYERLADAYVGLERYEEAKKYLDMCSFDDDVQNSLHISFLYGQVYLNQKEYQKAISSFEDVLLEIDSDPIYYYAAIAYWKVKKYKRALEYFDRISGREEIVEGICDFFIEEKDEEHFLRYVEKIHGEEQKEYYKSDFYLSVKDYEKAEQCLIGIVKKYNHAALYNQLLVVYQETKQIKKQRSVERKVLRLLPDGTMDEESFVDMKLAALLNLKYTEATVAKYIDQMLEQSEQKNRVFVKLASFLCSEDYYRSAFRFLYTNVPNNLSEEEYVFTTRLRIYVRLLRKEFGCAYKEFQEYLKYKPLEKDLEVDYATTCLYLRHYEEALKTARLHPMDGRMAAICLYCYNMLGKTEEEFALLDQINHDLDQGKEFKNIDYVIDALDLLAHNEE